MSGCPNTPPCPHLASVHARGCCTGDNGRCACGVDESWFVALWNARAPEECPRVGRLTSEQAAELSRYGREDVAAAVERLKVSPRCRGVVGDWRADAGWLLSDGTIPRVLAGAYDWRATLSRLGAP